MPEPALAAVLWDMDGTLIDTEGVWIEAQRRLAAETGAAWSHSDGLACVGQAMAQTVKAMQAAGVALPTDMIAGRLLAEVVESLYCAVPWQPGALDLVSSLMSVGVRQAIVTTSPRQMADLVVSALPAGAISAIVSIDDVTSPKPHPEPYLQAAAKLGAEPRRCVAIEDSQVGIASALAAGTATVGIPNNTKLDATDSWVRIESLTQIDTGRLERIVRAHMRQPDVSPAYKGHSSPAKASTP